MEKQKVLSDIIEFIPKENVKLDEPMSKHTSFKTGGNAEFYILVDNENQKYVCECIKAIKEVAKITGIYENGYRVISNVGEDGGQVIPHLHFHVIGGKTLGDKIVV